MLANRPFCQCDFLSSELPEQLSYPGSDDYEYQQARYWSIQQGRTAPACRFAPEDAEQVSFAVLTSRSSNCSFSVKSGGHAAFAGASNIEDGLTIDLIHLNDITVSADRKQASLGPGNVWYDVYSTLSPMGLTVIGGRVSAIGVGGLTLGGGISFFSNRYGWACDNVNAYEVVFADGSIHEVTSTSEYDDLYWALRGGGNNFGIVTRFDVLAYPQGDLWGGSQTFLYTDWTADALNDALYYFDEGSRVDPDAHVYIAYGYVQPADIYLIITSLQYAKPEPYPDVLHNFTSVPGAFINTLRVDDLPSMTREFDNTTPQAARYVFDVQLLASMPELI
jgi:FAD/FMN-containing dehydrogenase